MRPQRLSWMPLLFVGALFACTEPTRPEASESSITEPQLNAVVDPADEQGWRGALAEEVAARMAADDALRNALANLTTVVVVEERVVADGTSATILAQCPDDTILTGGGANSFGGIGIADILYFGPVAGFPEVYGATMSNQSGKDLTLKATAICLVLPSAS